MIKHYLNFISSNHGRREIEEPIGFDGVDFGIEQDTYRFGRDVSFAGGSTKVTFNYLPEHCFELLKFNLDKFGYEAIVKYEIDFDDDTKVIGDLDFLTVPTDRVTRFEFTVIEENIRSILKINADTKVNLLSDKDLKGNPITPCEQHAVFQSAFPIINTSRWSNPTIGQSFEFNPMVGGDFVNPVQQQDQYDIEDSLTWLLPRNNDTGDDFRHISTATNLETVKVTLKHKVKWDYIPFTPSSSRQGSVRVRVVWGQTNIDNGITAGQFIDMYYDTFTGNSNQTRNLPEEMTATIPFVNSTDIIWIGYTIGSNGSTQVLTFDECETIITATSVALNTVVPMIRVIDAIKYVVKSTSGLDVVAPRFDAGGEYYDQFITTTQLMRRLTDKPVNISFKQICEDWFPEPLADYCIKTDNTVFIGFYEDFYRNIQLGSFEQETISDFEQNFNERYTVGGLKLKYKSYGAQKETQEGNTNTTLHAESEWRNGNQRTPKSTDINIGWIRDPLLKETERRKAYDLSDSTASQDDDKIFVDDVVAISESNRLQTETAFIQHQATTGKLILKNNSSFSWVQLGIFEDSVFTILNGANAGSYFVVKVENTQLTLQTGDPATNIVGENTTFTYEIGALIYLKNRTNEGFISIENIAGGDNFSNLRFTPKRLISKYYNKFLATTTRYTSSIPYKNTVYKNNPLATTTFLDNGNQVTLIEGDDFTPIEPILDPFTYDMTLLMSLQEYLNLRDAARNENGFIRVWSSDGMPVKGYPQKMIATFESKGQNTPEDFQVKVDSVLEIKYEPFYMSIFGTGDGLIIINGEEIAASSFQYQIDEYEKLLIFDGNGRLLFVPIPFDRVQVNSSNPAQNIIQLAQWLNSLKPE